MNGMQLLNDNWCFYYKSKWRIANVPGCIHLDLLKHNQIKDPFIAKNEEDVKWVGKQNWDYKLIFKPEKYIFEQKQIFIRFEGVDTYSDIFLNGQKVLSTNNMFHEWTVNIKPILKRDDNELLIKLRSPINEVLPKMEELGYELPADNDQAGKTSPHTRKAPYHYGWDWGPSLVTMGIWKNISLVGYEEFYFQDLMITNVSCNQNIANLSIELLILSDINRQTTFTLSEAKYNLDKKFNITLEKGQNHIQKELSLDNPDLWWPIGHGEQPLYDFKVEIATKKIRH